MATTARAPFWCGGSLVRASPKFGFFPPMKNAGLKACFSSRSDTFSQLLIIVEGFRLDWQGYKLPHFDIRIREDLKMIILDYAEFCFL
ncbi:unnamed protein product [Victoria cruziana]